MHKKATPSLLDWYHTHGRHELPWRNTEDPYHIYLSEVMLQQTQVKTVLERFYFPFLQRFPSLKALGDAALDDVLKMWEGLGYYTRAKNLYKTATLVERLPSDIDALIALPGIGKNTAHAIAAFAFGQPVPVMEANVRRILCRIFALQTPAPKDLWDKAYGLLDTQNPFEHNQAMMDIGSGICLPKNPKCTLCPFASICAGKQTPQRYPLKQKKIVPIREEFIMVYRYNDRLSLTQRKGKFLHGLWGFESVDVPLCAAEYLGEVTHAYTHFKLVCKVYAYDELDKEQTHYFNLSEIRKLAISKVDEKILKLL
jgi:A/G-specific adenine glycosylase